MNNRPASNSSTLFSIGFWISLILFLAIWFYMLGARTLVPTDEGRYAEMAREMVATSDWVTPRLNGIKYFEKPPLQTWMNALTFELFGLGEWQARLWTGLSALLGIFLIGYTGSKLIDQRTGVTTAIILASSLWWAGLGHVNTLDMGLSGMLTLVLCGFLLAQHDQASITEQRNAMLMCWLGMALATLSKGMIGIAIPGSVLFLYSLIARDWRIWQRLHLVKGLVLFFTVTIPWFVLVSQANQEFLRFFFIHEHFERFLSKVHHREGPWYYFIPLLIVGIFPWLGLLPQSLWNGAKRQASSFQPGQLLLIWVIFTFVFFSISSSKLPSYILPIFPAIALLMAMYLNQQHQGPARGLHITSLIMSLFGLLGLAVCAFSRHIPGLYDKQQTAKSIAETALHDAYLPYVAIASLIMLVAGFVAWRASRRRAIWVLAWAGFFSVQLLMYGHEPWGRYIAGTNHLPAIQAELAQLPSNTPIYAIGRYEQSLPFYLRHTLVLVEHSDEMAFGLEHEPHLWIPTREAFVKKWLDDQAMGIAALAIIRPDIYDSFVQQGIPMRVIAKDPRRVIVSSKVN